MTNNNIKILEEALQALPHEEFAKKILKENIIITKMNASKKEEKVHQFKPGEVVHIDGFQDNLYKTDVAKRHVLVDEVSAYFYGVSYEAQETNKGFMRIIIQIFLLTAIIVKVLRLLKQMVKLEFS